MPLTFYTLEGKVRSSIWSGKLFEVLNTGSTRQSHCRYVLLIIYNIIFMILFICEHGKVTCQDHRK